MTPILGMLSVVLGLLIGAFGTFIGAGGGFLLVPVLLLGYHFAPADAVGTSLALVFLNAFSGSVAYLRQGRVDIALGWKFAAATIPGAVGGAYLTRALSSRSFSVAFGVLLVAIAVVLSLLVGLLSSVFGIGGGIIHVPFLIVALGLPVHIATTTSHFVLSISTLVGAVTFLVLGHVDPAPGGAHRDRDPGRSPGRCASVHTG